MLRFVQVVKKASLMAILPLLCGSIAVLASPQANQASGRTLTPREMSRSFGGTDYVDKCLDFAPGCDDLDDYWQYYAMCTLNSNDPGGCADAPAGIYNYGYVNTKGCEKALTPATSTVTCVASEDDVVCAYYSMCTYTEYDLGMIKWGSCAPMPGVVGYWAPMWAYDLGDCAS